MILKTYYDQNKNNAVLTVELDQYHFPKQYTLTANGESVTFKATKTNEKIIHNLYNKVTTEYITQLANEQTPD